MSSSHACSSDNQSLVQVGESAGPECKAVLQEINQLVEKRLESDAKWVKELFGASLVGFFLHLN